MTTGAPESPRLVLLNGPPASGKSTLAKRWIARHALALNLDIDVVRGLLGSWADRPDDAGIAARRLAIAMARTHLRSGYDVIVPQFLAREEFIVALDDAAQAEGSRFVELALLVDRNDTLRSFAARSDDPETQEHRDADLLLDRSGGLDALARMHDAFEALVATRPTARRIEVARGDVEETLARLESAINDGT